ncbi:vitamin K epoxide reductase [Calothrix sp. NIES-4071]|nr:vitamin K epoxide reductase [Calothrix sp. NIES-4071]BAZ56047.1 vitamin K epoxide reductase [Calothrix sp. NIES-4105]
MSRRRSIPWIHRTSRLIIAAIAGLGALNTGYLSFIKLSGGAVACVNKTAGCDSVLSSPWATVLGVPLAIFGFLAYASMTGLALAPLAIKPENNKEQRKKLESLTWLLLLAGSIAMTVFSGYLMYLLAFQIKAVCYYCIASALFSLSILVLTIIGRSWEDIGQILFTAVIVGMVTLIGTLAVYAPINNQIASSNSPGDASNPNRNGVTVVQTASGAGQIFFDARKAGEPDPKSGWEITTTSGDAEIQLAKHLASVGAKEYVAFWCPHCHEQKLLFGKEAYTVITENNVKTECAPESPVGKPQDCQAAGVKGFPTWIINGKSYSGVQNLDQLAKASGYTGPRNFKFFR